MGSMKNVLSRLRGLREQEGISIVEMARVGGVTVEEYQGIESGEKDLSFSFLFKCAARLGVDISEIVTGKEPHLQSYTISKQEDGMPIKRREGFTYTHLAYMLKDRLAEPFVVVAKYSKEDEESPIKLSNHSGQEFDYILEGKLKVQIGDQVEVLCAGDSIQYNGMKKHGMVAVGGTDCKFISVVIKGDMNDNIAPLREEKPPKYDIIEDYDKCYKHYIKETVNAKGMLTDIEFMPTDNFNFAYDIVDEIAKKSPHKLALLWVSPSGEEKKLSFSDISRYSNKTANYFTRLGIKKGDRVMLVLRRSYQFWYSILALHKIGAVAIPATDQLVTKDFDYRFESAGVSAIICTSHGEVYKSVLESVEKNKDVKILSMIGGARDGFDDFDKGIEKESDSLERVETSKDDYMLMYFTSGTTGYPKIATHNFTYPLGHLITAKWWHNVSENSLHFTVSDTGWAKSMWGKLYGQWLCEAAIFAYDFDRFNPMDILPMFDKYKITTFCAPPTIFRLFIKEDLSKYNLSSLKYATIAGEALNPEVYQQFLNATNIKLMEGFGQTETTLTVANLYGTPPKPGSMGKPSPAYDIKLIDSNGKEVKYGEAGELVISTKNGVPCGMFCGYYKDEEKKKEVWYDDIYHTGDVAWQDEDGYFWYVGRTDDLIKSSGYRIGPFEIESVLMEYPCVMECAVTGVPDPVRGQVVKATIVLAKGTQGTEELKKDIQNYVKKHTAPYKYPRIIEFVDDLPKTISGKIRRVEIRNKENKG